jgi:hypothetical protein
MSVTTKPIQRTGFVNFAAAPTPVMNRTGGTRTKGDIVALDLLNTEAATPPAQLGNAVPVAAGNIDGFLAVVLSESTADDEEMKVCVAGPCQAKVDGGTLDVGYGDKLIASAASYSLTRSDATTDVIHAKALETNSGSAALKWVYLLPFPISPGTDESP